jgi:hypothetical protein
MLSLGLLGATTLSPGLYKWTTGVRVFADITLTGSAADSMSNLFFHDDYVLTHTVSLDLPDLWHF